ncbi:MAG: hypothetical protein K5911_03250 [Eubacteriales bacterium]|nr:hypothetical protein [Eubacteriales bacterium]
MTMILALWIMKRTEADPAKERTAVITVLIMAAAVSAYAALKSYPEDYVDGKLIVDGAKMARDTFKGAGGCCGFLAGWMLQRRFTGFSTDVPGRAGQPVRCGHTVLLRGGPHHSTGRERSYRRSGRGVHDSFLYRCFS